VVSGEKSLAMRIVATELTLALSGLNVVVETESQEAIEIEAEVETEIEVEIATEAEIEIVGHGAIEVEEILETVATEGPIEDLIEIALVPIETVIAVDVMKGVGMIAMIEAFQVGMNDQVGIEKKDSLVVNRMIEGLVTNFQMTSIQDLVGMTTNSRY
jgi:hypothetical protein